MGLMLVEVYTNEKPAVPHRAVVIAVTLLAITLALAGAMTWRRSGDPLGDRISLAEWGISLRLPLNFQAQASIPTPLGPAYPFYGLTDPGVSIVVFPAIPSKEAGTSYDLCVRILSSGGQGAEPTSLHGIISRATTNVDNKRLGPFLGAEVHDSTGGTVVRAALGRGGEGYAVALHVEPSGMNSRLYRLFDRTCLSIESTSR